MIYFKNITRYTGMFEKCFLEPSLSGFSVFDSQKRFVGEMLNEGFAVEDSYEYRDVIIRELTKKKIPVFGYDAYYDLKLEQNIADILYGDPNE